jgi:hypothetical protein
VIPNRIWIRGFEVSGETGRWPAVVGIGDAVGRCATGLGRACRGRQPGGAAVRVGGVVGQVAVGSAAESGGGVHCRRARRTAANPRMRSCVGGAVNGDGNN